MRLKLGPPLSLGQKMRKGQLLGPGLWLKMRTITGLVMEPTVKPRTIAEEDEAIVGSWFWTRDETHFESDPSPVYRAICRSSCSVEQEPDASHRPPELGGGYCSVQACPMGYGWLPIPKPL